jgi:Cu+-exporting ATPase
VIVLAMVPAAVHHWQWLSLTLAAPVVVYGGLPFHRARWSTCGIGRRHRTPWSRSARIAAFRLVALGALPR